MSAEPIRIAMWSGPRNLSTALMRSWENRYDTDVLDEPLYAHYLATTGLDHPMAAEIVAAGPAEIDAAVDRCVRPPGVLPVSYQKHMSHHLLDDMDRSWLDELRNFLLIRDPVEVLASYTRIRDDVTLADIGLPQQMELAERAELIIDAADFLRTPERYLRAMCSVLGIAFSDRMLSWPAGRRDSDGIWAPAWYDAVEASTGFQPPRSEAERRAVVERLDPALAPLADEATALYRELAVGRFVL
ncbi:MAG: HAD family hydrolase [Actinomycetota bacterium]